LEFTHYYGKHRRRSNYVIQKDVLHKGKTFLFRADFGLTEAIQDLAEELGHTDSKVIKDILEDFFLEQTIKRQREDVEDFIK